MKLVLASGSPRRRKFLEDLGIEFDVLPSNEAEKIEPGLTPDETVISLALHKAQNVKARVGDAAVLAADSLVMLDGEIIGKPKDAADAVRILRKLSGRTHEVKTGVVLLNGDKVYREAVTSTVRFNKLDDKFISDYVATGSPLDKAGAYGIQDGNIVAAYEGSYTNIIGLPMERVTEILRAEKLLPEGE